MEALNKMKCVPCRGGEPKLTNEEITDLMPQVPDWEVIERDGIQRLVRVYKTKDFTQALEFTNLIGGSAEVEDHHPAILTEWGKVTVTWWTHIIKGLHKNDFIMAAKIDKLFILEELS